MQINTLSQINSNLLPFTFRRCACARGGPIAACLRGKRGCLFLCAATGQQVKRHSGGYDRYRNGVWLCTAFAIVKVQPGRQSCICVFSVFVCLQIERSGYCRNLCHRCAGIVCRYHRWYLNSSLTSHTHWARHSKPARPAGRTATREDPDPAIAPRARGGSFKKVCSLCSPCIIVILLCNYNKTPSARAGSRVTQPPAPVGRPPFDI